jgi:hypothetical protein
VRPAWVAPPCSHPPRREAPGSIELFATRMRLTMTLVHEEDMLRVLDDLANAQLGRVSVERCEMNRANGAAIKAECA